MSYVENGWETEDTRRIIDEERRAHKRSQAATMFTLTLIAVGFIGFFCAAVLTATAVYQILLRKLKQRPSVIFLATALPGAGLLWWFTKTWGVLWGNLQQNMVNMDVGGAWVALNWHLIIAGVGVGLIVGWLFTVDAAVKFKTSKWMVESPSMWSYKFRFADTPWEKWRKKRVRTSITRDTYRVKPDETIIGVNVDTGEPVLRSYDEANRHMFVSGAPGTGKTVFITSMVKQDIHNGVSATIVNFKPDRAFTEKVAKWAHEAGRVFYHFSYGTDEEYVIQNNPSGHAYFDPLEGLGITEKVEMVLNMRAYDTASEVYKSAAHEILQVVINALSQMNVERATSTKTPIVVDEGETRKLASALDNLETLAYACEGTPIWKAVVDVKKTAHMKGSNSSRGLTSLQTQLRTILSSEFGQWIGKPKHPEEKFIDIFNLTRGDDAPVILFDLNSDSEKDFARYLGSMILANITSASARRRDAGVRNQANVYVDEFQVLPPDAVRGLVEKARASKLAITLSQQSIQQVITSAERNGEAMLDALLDTVGNFVIFAGSSQDTAEKLSRIVGPHEVTKYQVTTRRHGFWFSINWDDIRKPLVSENVVMEPIIYPAEFMNLESPSVANNWRSVAIVVKRTPMESGLKHYEGGALTRRVQVLVADDVLEPVDLVNTPVKVQKPWLESTNTAPLPRLTPPVVSDVEEYSPEGEETVEVSHVVRSSMVKNTSSRPVEMSEEVWPPRKQHKTRVMVEDDKDDLRLNTALSSLQEEFTHNNGTTPTVGEDTTPVDSSVRRGRRRKPATNSSFDMWNSKTDIYGNTTNSKGFDPVTDTDF